VRLLHVDTGFTAKNLTAVNVVLVDLKDPERRAQATRSIVEAIGRVPGVEVAGAASALPPVTAQRGTRFAVEGQPSDDAADRSSSFTAGAPASFRARGTPLVWGRMFTSRDDAAAPPVVMINRRLAARLFPAGAVGRRIRLVAPDQSDAWREIVGVVADVRYSGLDDPSEAAIYVPFDQSPMLWTYVMAPSPLPPATLTRAIRDAVRAAAPTLDAANIVAVDQLVREA